jgi:hypothetical protein
MMDSNIKSGIIIGVATVLAPIIPIVARHYLLVVPFMIFCWILMIIIGYGVVRYSMSFKYLNNNFPLFWIIPRLLCKTSELKILQSVYADPVECICRAIDSVGPNHILRVIYIHKVMGVCSLDDLGLKFLDEAAKRGWIRSYTQTIHQPFTMTMIAYRRYGLNKYWDYWTKRLKKSVKKAKKMSNSSPNTN